ncbi:MAG: hypothetical protein EOO01_02910 [Chitinophagaceae bacterium]|nr:MAG: hypothetical protein EOO01_02910 [Chitinophagaceae bacterium]
MFISYRTSKLHPAMWKTHLRMQEGDIGFALDLPRKFTKAANDPADTIFLTMDQLRYNAGIDDGDMYQYASSSDAGSYFVPTVVTDSTVSGNFFVHMSRKRTYSNGSNMDNDDSSILKGTFTNVKILRESL